MSERAPRRLSFGAPPSRLPGEGEVELEGVAGDIQLAPPRRPGSQRVGRLKATEWQKRNLYGVGERAPVSGVYDIVDEEGRYLQSQVTCHEGQEFPATYSGRARSAPARDDGDEREPHYRFRLAYEAAHLQPPAKINRTIYRPGQRIPTSGVYDVVDLDGKYLLHQRACVEGHEFPATEGPEPGSYGYRLEYPAEHLSER